VLPELPAFFDGVDTDGTSVDGPWWSAFEDEDLNTVMAYGLRANFNLRIAADRLRAADAAAQAALAPILPNLAFRFGISGAPDEVTAGRTGFLTTDLLDDFTYNASGSISADLGLDVSGRYTLGYQAARSDKNASAQDRANAASDVANAIANTWFDIALTQGQQALLVEQLQTSEQILELTELRFERGEGSAVEVLQQRQQLAAARARLPLVRANLGVYQRNLAVLLGQPSRARHGLPMPEGLPDLPPRPSLGVPQDLLQQRPDLVAADARLNAAWRRRMSSERAFLPSLSVGASLDGSFSNYQNISFGLQPTVEFGSFFGWGVSASVSLPIFDGGRTVATLRQARANEAVAANNLGALILQGIAEVELAASIEQGQSERLDAVLAQAAASREAFEAAMARYRDGVVDYNTVLNTLKASQENALLVLQTERDVLTARINLHDALGGMWTQAYASSSARGSSQ
jgi:NodT family efflux transporter outer membrane factor (OMF) lipoprotein